MTSTDSPAKPAHYSMVLCMSDNTWRRELVITTRVVDEIRRRLPMVGQRADHRGSAKAAIKLFCLECQGDVRAAVAACADEACPLWPHRPGRDCRRERAPGVVPTVAEYEALKVKQAGGAEAMLARRVRLRKARAAMKGSAT